ncbi:hypothetical protein [Alkalibacillus flavidus]
MFVILTPTAIDTQYEGYVYQLGSNEANGEKVTIEIKGELQGSIFTNKQFAGSLTIDGKQIPSHNAVEDTVTLELEESLGGLLVYSEQQGRSYNIIQYGELHQNGEFEEIVIKKFSEDNGWNGEDGMIIAAPASNKAQALNVANDILSPSNPLE